MLNVDEIRIDEGKAFTLPGGTAFPVEPMAGMIYYRTDENILYRYDGSVWVKLTDELSGLPLHAAAHEGGGGDVINIESLIYASGNTKNWLALLQDGAGGVVFTAPIKRFDQADEPALDANQVAIWVDTDDGGRTWLVCHNGSLQRKVEMASHARIHASEHMKTGIDVVTVEDLGTGSAIVNQIPATDGAGGLALAVRWATSFVVVFRSSGVIFPNNDTGFCHVGGAGAVTATEALAQLKAIKSTMISIEGYCSGGSGTFTLRKNGADTTLTGVVDSVGRFNIIGEVDFVDGDLISLAYDSGVNWTIYGIQLKLKSEVV